MKAAANPDAYVAALKGWRFDLVTSLRQTVRAAGGKRLEECIKWGHLVYLHEGPVLLIRAEEERVLLGFWRGNRLTEAEPRLKPSGKYEMATIHIREGDRVTAAIVRRLVKDAIALNEKLGNPQDAAANG